jgi:hypothetical protein
VQQVDVAGAVRLGIEGPLDAQRTAVVGVREYRASGTLLEA